MEGRLSAIMNSENELRKNWRGERKEGEEGKKEALFEGERKECDINGTRWRVSKWEREMGKSCAIKNYSSWGRNEKVDGINCLHDWASPRTGKGESYEPTVRRSSRKIFPRSWIKSKGPWRREEKNKRKKWPKSSKNSKMRKRSSWNNCVRSAPWKWKRVKTATQKRTTESENWRRNLPLPPKTSRAVNKASNITSWSWPRPRMNWKLLWPDLPISKNRQVHFLYLFLLELLGAVQPIIIKDIAFLQGTVKPKQNGFLNLNTRSGFFVMRRILRMPWTPLRLKTWERSARPLRKKPRTIFRNTLRSQIAWRPS